jgi:hypothetical protein
MRLPQLLYRQIEKCDTMGVAGVLMACCSSVHFRPYWNTLSQAMPSSHFRVGLALILPVAIIGLVYARFRYIKNPRVNEEEGQTSLPASSTPLELDNYFTCTAEVIFSPNKTQKTEARQALLNCLGGNKKHVYTKVVATREDQIGDDIPVTKYECTKALDLEKVSLFVNPSKIIKMAVISGSFPYEASTEATLYWTPNFADVNLFGYASGSLLAQDEQQVLEHPVLYFYKYDKSFTEDLKSLKEYEVIFFQNVPRMGNLDTFSPVTEKGWLSIVLRIFKVARTLYGNNFSVASLEQNVPRMGNLDTFSPVTEKGWLSIVLRIFKVTRTLYGNNFSVASLEQIDEKLTLLNPPVRSNIFAILAPRGAAGQCYSRVELAKLFFRSLTACYGIKKLSGSRQSVMYVGNWGMGAFGNDPKASYLLQLAAADFSQVDEIRVHALEHKQAFQEATELLRYIKTNFPGMTVGEFLTHLAENAKKYGLYWRNGNGT